MDYKWNKAYLELLRNKSEIEKLERYPEFPISHNRRKPLLKSKKKSYQKNKQDKRTMKYKAEKPIKLKVVLLLEQKIFEWHLLKLRNNI